MLYTEGQSYILSLAINGTDAYKQPNGACLTRARWSLCSPRQTTSCTTLQLPLDVCLPALSLAVRDSRIWCESFSVNATYLHSQYWPRCNLNNLKVAIHSKRLGLLLCVRSQCKFTRKFNTTPPQWAHSLLTPIWPCKAQCLLCASPAKLIHLSPC